MKRFREIETLFEEGFALNTNGDAKGACDKWLVAWEQVKGLFADGIATDIFDLNRKYKWKHFPGNYAQYLEMELHNAGIEDNTYFQKRIDYCQELLQWCGGQEDTANNTRIALGEAYFWSGDEASGEQVFKDWIQEDPDSGWAYSGWAGCYSFNRNGSNYERAEEILLAGYSRETLHDGIYVVEGLANVYEEMGESGKADKFRAICSELYSDETDGNDSRKAEPVRVVKVGRNEPCPCGSGKKYKKCCGA